MTAATSQRFAVGYADNNPIPPQIPIPIAANVNIIQGTMFGISTSGPTAGYLVPATTTTKYRSRP